jgi:NitT/TauT family transport system ATP-binding protein
MISLVRVSTGYSKGLDVLQDLSFMLEDEGVYALMSPSGTGKTTLLKLLCGLIKPNKGRIDGLQGKRVVLQFQEDRLLSWCSVMRNVLLAMPIPDNDKAKHILQALGIEDITAYPASFSGGMKRRVSLARAIAFHAEILLLDEPFSGMDAELKESIAPYLRKAAPLIVFSTHDPAEVKLLGAQIISIGESNPKTEPQLAMN